MKIPFLKYQGTGNDFILIDNRKELYSIPDIALLCHPKFGIGADGLMFLKQAEGYDFEMVYYNSDGKISSMCGNGGRCIVDFAKRLGIFPGNHTSFIAVDGPHKAVWSPDIVELQMKDVNSIEQRDNHTFILNTGSPHYVEMTENIDSLELIETARKIRYNNEFKAEGINVNFVEIIEENHLRVRTYERGVENETLSCGTGVTASAISYSIQKNSNNGEQIVYINTPGGNLHVRFNLNQLQANNIWLCGPANKVYEGIIEL